MNKELVSIIVLNYNAGDLLLNCIKSIKKSSTIMKIFRPTAAKLNVKKNILT